MALFCVAGATSWGLTLAWLLSLNDHDVVVLVRTQEEADGLTRRRGLDRLPALRLGPRVEFELMDTALACEGLVLAVPAQSMRLELDRLPQPGAPVLSAAKGLERGTFQRMSEVICECWPGASVGALSGPNLSREIIAASPTASVIACRTEADGHFWQAAFSNSRFRCYRSADIVGVELAGALKNVIAIAAGVAWGLGMGANTVAALMTRGLAEMARLGVALGAQPTTFQGLAGIGDLSATCFSPLSRNRRMGELLAHGATAEVAAAEIGEAIEGVETAHAALEMAERAGVDVPICREVVAVLDSHRSINEAIDMLLGRALQAEGLSP